MADSQDSPPDSIHESLYSELHRLAAMQLRNERPNHTLAPTAVVNEAWMVLQRQANLSPADRSQYLAAAAVTVRRILIDHARRKNAEKHGGGVKNLSLQSGLFGGPGNPGSAEVDVLELEEAMHTLAEQNQRAAKVVELRFYGGLSNEEIAHELDVSLRTVVGDWTFARAWLSRVLSQD